jgi:hypothetical protein
MQNACFISINGMQSKIKKPGSEKDPYKSALRRKRAMMKFSHISQSASGEGLEDSDAHLANISDSVIDASNDPVPGGTSLTQFSRDHRYISQPIQHQLVSIN